MKKTDDKTKAPEAIRITSAKQLKALLAQPVLCRFRIDEDTMSLIAGRGQVIELPCSRMSADTEERVRTILRRARPPFKKRIGEKNDVEFNDFDRTDVKYIEAAEKDMKIARSLIIYLHCELVAAESPALQDEKAIHELVNPMFPEKTLEIISTTIQGGGIALEDLTNFTSPSGLAS